MWQEFKKFAFKGNVIDMAVGVIIGGAFSTIVSSLVNDIVMPIFGRITAEMDFKALKIVLSEATETKPEAAIMYGNFIQNMISFLIITFSIFIVVKSINKAKSLGRHAKAEPEEEEPKPPTREELLTEIRDILKESKLQQEQEQGQEQNEQQKQEQDEEIQSVG